MSLSATNQSTDPSTSRSLHSRCLLPAARFDPIDIAALLSSACLDRTEGASSSHSRTMRLITFMMSAFACVLASGRAQLNAPQSRVTFSDSSAASLEKVQRTSLTALSQCSASGALSTGCCCLCSWLAGCPGRWAKIHRFLAASVQTWSEQARASLRYLVEQCALYYAQSLLESVSPPLALATGSQPAFSSRTNTMNGLLYCSPSHTADSPAVLFTLHDRSLWRLEDYDLSVLRRQRLAAWQKR